MSESQQRRLGTSLIAAGALLIGIGSAEAQVEKLFPARLPQFWASLLVVLGILCIAVGILSWLMSRVPLPIGWHDYECHRAREKDLASIHDFAKKYVGDGISSIDIMRRWYAKNSSVFFVIIIEKGKSFDVTRRLVGYFCAIPLTESALRKIENGEISGRDIPSEYIARVRRECHAVYIGGLAAKGWGAKGALLAVVHNELTSGRQWAKTFYTRPITEEGLRVAIKKGFSAINPSNHGKVGAIYKLEL